MFDVIPLNESERTVMRDARVVNALRDLADHLAERPSVMALIVVLVLVLGVGCTPPGPRVSLGGKSAQQYENDLVGCRKYAAMDPGAHPSTMESVTSLVTLSPRSEHVPGQSVRDCLIARGYTVED